MMADGRRLRQVIHNLIENAVKYSPRGGPVHIGVSAGRQEATITVSDAGVGIPRHQWDRIFRPFHRAGEASTAAVAGSGLGLAISKGIVEAHGGRIWVESEPGIGTTFAFTVTRAHTTEDDESSRPRRLQTTDTLRDSG
ncbi:MAG: multi-sensor signal transduction histidine kinase [Chloroflexi bacterium]|nr:multi-sensor signal transduction histidine kinase [Chloroflexota bacterium]